MKVTKVKAFSALSYRIWKLYRLSFPKEERLPYWFLLFQILRTKADFQAYRDGKKVIGFSYSIAGKSADFLLFLAVSPEFQSQGYGTAMLQNVKNSAGEKPLIVAIEPPFELCDNAEQRLRRLAFYEKNGFQLTEHFYQENVETYQVMTTKLPFKAKAFAEDLCRFFGNYIRTKVV
ncbi:GNAT family N-acetyltransferase [Streptococcus porci]|uniref:GNAT family N-acetyltransferase n=1 Tax=Streptococcus porci TaxID=502567 RepID=UPI0003FD0BDE|nr:GNAT family N-acetyltransferase [Streptococcus porci]